MDPQTNSLKSILKSHDSYLLLLWAVLIGAAAGLVTVAFRFAASYAEKLNGILFSFTGSVWKVLLLFVILTVLGIIVGRLSDSETLIKGSGIPQLEGQLMGYFSPKCIAVLIKKFISVSLCLVGGLSFGKAGPSMQLGAMAAQGVCKATKRSRSEQKYLLICGASAALSAIFNAPLTGLMFALEEIHKNFSARAIFPAMISAITADIIANAFFGSATTLHLSQVSVLPFCQYGLYIALGIIAGLFGALYHVSLFASQRLYAGTRLPSRWCMVIPFILSGVLGLLMPEVLGGGSRIIEALASGKYALGFMAAALAVKFVFTMLCIGSGAPGGIFFPMLVLGALVGSIFGTFSIGFFGLSESCMMNFILLGMAGTFAAVVRAPLTGILMVVELSGSFTQLIGLTIVVCIASIVAKLLGCRPVYERMLDNMTPDPIYRTKSKQDQNIIDLAVTYDSPLAGKHISEVEWPKSCLAVSITRGSEQLIPHGDTSIEPGDIISVVCPVGDEALVQATAGSSVSAV